MGLFENLPFTNFENLNLDMIVKDISTMKGNEEYLKDKVDEIEEQIGDFNIEELEGRIDALEASDRGQNTEINSIKGRVSAAEGNIQTNSNEINSIKSRLTTAEGNIQNNADDIADTDEASRGRDDALSARIRNLEQATIHDIYNYYGSKNMIIFGSNLINLPANCCDSDGFPFCWGNKYNQRFSAGTETPRAWKMVSNGISPDTAQNAYDYYQVGSLALDLQPSQNNPVTLTLKVRGNNTLFKHTYHSFGEVWEIASGCQIKFANDTNLGGNTIWLMGTPQSWDAFLGTYTSPGYGTIQFIYLEYGEGSIDVNGNIPWDSKDRNFFGHDATPTLPEAIITGQVTEDASVTYYDLVGEPQTITSQIVMTANLKKYGKMVDGYLVVRMNLNENIGDILSRGAQFTLTGLAMTYDGGVNAPMPDATSPIRGVANDSRYYEWNYNNTQNTYLFVNISNDGTWNLKLLSGGMRNYTGTSTTYTEFRIPIHYIAN